MIEIFPKLKSKFGLHQFLLTTPQTSPETDMVNAYKMQQLPNIEKTEDKWQFVWVKWTSYKVWRIVCLKFKTDTDEINIVVYRYRKNLCFKDNEIDLKLTEKQNVLTKRNYLLNYIDVFVFVKKCILMDGTTFQNWYAFPQNGCFLSITFLPILLGKKNLSFKHKCSQKPILVSSSLLDWNMWDGQKI